MQPEAVAFLACGWSLASRDAHGTSIALQGDEETVLVDAGGGVTKGLVRTFGTEDLQHVYLTHEHADHTWGFPGLVHHLRFDEPRESLTIHGPAPALGRARESLEVLGVTYPFDIEWEPIPNERGGNERTRWAPADHSVPTLAYRFGDVVVCADTGPSQEIASLADRASLLVHEASHHDPEITHGSGHSTPEDAAKIAHEAGVDQLALIHIHPSLGRERALELCPFDHAVAPEDGDVLARRDDRWQPKKVCP